MLDAGQGRQAAGRLYFLDNLRTFMIFLVVVVHAGLVYESSGSAALFWIVDDYSTTTLVGPLNTVLDLFVMASIFLVAGYLAPRSLESKSTWTFIVSKFRRLVVPWAVAVLTLIPLYKVIYLYSRSIPQEAWTRYFHFTNVLLSQNWLWFLPVLFYFNLLYILFARLRIDMSRVTLKWTVPAAIAAGFIYSLFVAGQGWMGWTKTPWIDFQNERLLIYFLVYLIGAHCYRRRAFISAGGGRKFYYALLLTVWIPVLAYYHLYTSSIAAPGVYSFSGPAHQLLLWASAVMSIAGLVYLMLGTFRYFFNVQGRLGQELGANSYGVYIVHVAVLGGLALPMLGLGWPGLVKFPLLTVATYIVSNTLVSFYRRLPQFNRTGDGAMNKATTAILAITLLVFAACGQQQSAATDEQQQEAPRAPDVDINVAALQGNLVAINQHIAAGTDLNAKDQYGSTPLIVAITFGKLDVAKAIIEGGADLSVSNNEGSTPLHLAAFFGHTEIVQSLLENGADKNQTNNGSHTALESVQVPFETIKPLYDAIQEGLEPLGLNLDYERIKAARPQIAEMLEGE